MFHMCSTTWCVHVKCLCAIDIMAEELVAARSMSTGCIHDVVVVRDDLVVVVVPRPETSKDDNNDNR